MICFIRLNDDVVNPPLWAIGVVCAFHSRRFCRDNDILSLSAYASGGSRAYRRPF
jgi:hypothetical protein